MRLISFKKQVYTIMYIQKYRYICTVLRDVGQCSWRGMDQTISCETGLTTQYRLPARGLSNPLAGNPFNDYSKRRENGFGAPVARPGKTVLRRGLGREVAWSFQAVPCMDQREDSQVLSSWVVTERNVVERRVCKPLDQGESLRFSESGTAWGSRSECVFRDMGDGDSVGCQMV